MSSVDRISALRASISSNISARQELKVRAQAVELRHARLATSLAQELCPLKPRQRFRILGLLKPEASAAHGYLRAGKLYDFNDQLLIPSSVYQVDRVNAFGHGLKTVAQYSYSITARRVLRSGKLSKERYLLTPYFSIEPVNKVVSKRPAARSAPLRCRPTRAARNTRHAAATANWDHARAGLD